MRLAIELSLAQKLLYKNCFEVLVLFHCVFFKKRKKENFEDEKFRIRNTIYR